MKVTGRKMPNHKKNLCSFYCASQNEAAQELDKLIQGRQYRSI